MTWVLFEQLYVGRKTIREGHKKKKNLKGIENISVRRNCPRSSETSRPCRRTWDRASKE